jgi:Peptidase family M28
MTHISKTGPAVDIHGHFVPILVALVIASCQGQAEAVRVAMPEDSLATPVATADSAEATILASDMKQRIAFLSSDEMRGRATPSPGLRRAAEYIAGEFASFGLEPGGDDGTFLQTYALNGGARAPNVVGILRGSDPQMRDTYVVYSAHMDHVGVGLPDETGDSIYNGADDDASGTSAVIEIAQAFASMPERPKRSIVFVAVSGEEIGLYGSQAFVEHGPIDVRTMVADINIDMIGRNAPDSIVVIGLRYSDLGSTVHEAAADPPALGINVMDDPWPEERFFFRSDHYNFARAGVPAVFFFAGVHADYHQPSDEVDRIDGDKAARIARLAFRIGLRVADRSGRPEWTRDGLAEVRPRNVR